MLHRISVYASALALALTAAACGDNLASSDAHAHDDGNGSGIDSPGSNTIDAAPAAPIAIIAEGDFVISAPGILASMDPAALTVKTGLAPAGAIGDDVVLRHFGHELFVVNRADGNNVTVLDDRALTVTEQLATGAGTNPQDVAQVGTKLYVPIGTGKGVAVLTRGTTTKTVVDLSADDPDGNPNCESAFAVGTDVYVACDLLNDTTFDPRGLGEVYVIDTATDTIRTKFALKSKNPISLLESTGDGNLVVSSIDFSAVTAGCVEEITTGTTPTSACLVTNAKLVGYATRTQVTGTTMYISDSTTDFSNAGGAPASLVSMNLTTKALTTLSPATERIGDIGLCPDGTVIVADITKTKEGVRAYSATAELTTTATAVGLPPAAQHGIECY